MVCSIESFKAKNEKDGAINAALRESIYPIYVAICSCGVSLPNVISNCEWRTCKDDAGSPLKVGFEDVEGYSLRVEGFN